MPLRPFSFVLYLARNWLKVLPLFLAISFSVLAVTITPAIASSVTRDYYENLNFYNSQSTLTVSQNHPKFSEIQTLVQQIPEVETIYQTKLGYVYTQAIVATLRRPVIFLEPENIPNFLEFNKLKLAENEYQNFLESEKSLLVSDKILTNKNRKIGDNLGSFTDQTEVGLIGKFGIAGSLNSGNFDNLLAVGKYSEYLTSDVTFLLQFDPKKASKINSELELIKQDFPEIFLGTKDSYQATIDEDLNSIDVLLAIINIVVASVITFVAALLAWIFLQQRERELGIWLNLGFSKFELLQKLFLENLLVVFCSWIFGYFLVNLIYSQINNALYLPKAIAGLTLNSAEILSYSFLVPVGFLATVIIISGIKIRFISELNLVEKNL